MKTNELFVNDEIVVVKSNYKEGEHLIGRTAFVDEISREDGISVFFDDEPWLCDFDEVELTE